MGCGHALFSFFVFVHETIPTKKKKIDLPRQAWDKHISAQGSWRIKRWRLSIYFFVSLRREIDRVKGKVILSGELSYAAQSGAKTSSLFAPFIYKMHYFTKTGSGQT